MALSTLLLLSLAAVGELATPMPILELTGPSAPETELLVREGIKLAQSRDLEKRLEADFSLDRTWNNEVLFGGYVALGSCLEHLSSIRNSSNILQGLGRLPNRC